MKKCPYCGEEIQDLAKKCRFCGERIKEKSIKDNKTLDPEAKSEDSQRSEKIRATLTELINGGKIQESLNFIKTKSKDKSLTDNEKIILNDFFLKIEQIIKDASGNLGEPIKPHHYPIHIWIFLLILLGMFVCSLFYLPKYIKYGVEFEQGKTYYTEGYYDLAINSFEDVLYNLNNPKEVKIMIAKSYFQKHTETDDEIGLGFLDGIEFSETEWADLITVMPNKYQSYFTNVTK